MAENVHIHVNYPGGSKELDVPYGTTFLSLSHQFEAFFEMPIILARINGKLKELFKKIKRSGNIEFITLGDKIGHKVYNRTATFLLTKAARDVIGTDHLKKLIVQYSVGNGCYCELISDRKLDQELLDAIKKRMAELVSDDLPIVKKTVSLKTALKIFGDAGMEDKETLFRYRRASAVNIYKLEDCIDYNYGYMAPSTGILRWFDLYLYDDGFVLDLPGQETPTKLSVFKPSVKLFNVLKQSTKWGDMMEVSTIGDLNDVITKGGFNELILVQEALQEKKIAQIAEQIIKERGSRIVLIAGPSSSGKTTFSHRLSVQLRAHGMRPHPIQVDDYFVDREQTPRDENGDFNYECLGALDVDLFNEQITALLNGKEVELPEFNFISGRREFKGHTKKIGKNDILVIEGIHCLNDRLSYSLHKDSKFKIYISALTQLNIDEHNRIPTTDGRLIRRIVRDAAKRGNTAASTIARWDSVRRGEEENIFPYQESADTMFNSALIYELPVLKQYAEPLLFNITEQMKEYDEAKRLLKFFDYCLGVSSENVPQNSILREFIGRSCFKV